MSNGPRPSIRKNRPGRWRGYIGGVRVIEFEDSATESAEAAANRWLAAPSKPQKMEPANPAAPIEHVKINCDDVVGRHLERDPRFLRLYWQMQASFANNKYGYEVSLHEAAHAVLMEQDGINNVRWAGPDIVYNPLNKMFVGTSSRAIGDDEPNAVVNDDYIFRITSHMVAGGVALRVLTQVKEKGDEGDFEEFKRKYDQRPLSTGEKPDVFWKRVQDAVAARLTEPETKAKVLGRADEYLSKLYTSVR